MSDKSKEQQEDDASSASSAPTTVDRQFIRAAVLVAILAASVFATKQQQQLQSDSFLDKFKHELVLIHLLSFASWFGCSVWVSFVAGLIMFQNLPRHVFGRLQAKLFPAYFLYSAIMVSIAIASASALQWSHDATGNEDNSTTKTATTLPPSSLLIILVSILVNLVYLEPQTTKVMFQRHIVERRLGTGHEVGVLKPKDPQKANDPELRALSKQFGMLHGISTLMNLAALGFGCYWMNVCTQQMVK